MLQTINLTKVYKPKKGVPVRALDGVSLTFPEKGMVFLLGKSGSGKSTLLNTLGGLDKYDDGEIIIKDKSSKDFKQSEFDSYRNTYIGFIFQEYNILDEFSVGANIALAIQLQGRKASNEEIDNILKEVDLEGYGKRKPNELSGGQKQRVAIARALVKNPQIIMADEPTGALDSKTGKQVFDTLKKLSKDKLVIIVSHDRDFAECYADRIIELADGKVISDEEFNGAENEAEHLVSGLEFDEEVIKIDGGYQLTDDDRKQINEYIKSLGDGATIKVGLKNKRKGKFEKTDESKIKRSFADTFKLIKSKLPLKNAFKMGTSSLKNKPFRLVITIFLSFISFTMFGFIDTLGSFNKTTASVDSIVDSNINYATFIKKIEKTYSYSDGDSYTSEVITKMNPTDIENIKTNTNVQVVPISQPANLSLGFSNNMGVSDIEDARLNYLYNSLPSGSFIGATELNTDSISGFGYSLDGNLPANDNEIVITKYVADIFVKTGYKDMMVALFGGIAYGELQTITNTSAMINKELSFQTSNYSEYRKFKIVGILDTKFDESRYTDLWSASSQSGDADIFSMLSAMELSQYVENSLVGICFFNNGYLDKLNTSSDTSITVSSYGGMYTNSNSAGTSYFNLSFNKIDKLSNTDSSNIKWTNGAKTALADNEVIAPAESIISAFYSYAQENPSVYSSFSVDGAWQLLDNAITNYASANVDTAYENGFEDWMKDFWYHDMPEYPRDYTLNPFTNEEKVNAYGSYLKGEIHEASGLYENEFGGKCGQEVKYDFLVDNNLLSEISTDFSELYYYKNGDYGKSPSVENVKVVGYALNQGNDSNGVIYISDNLLKNFVGDVSCKYTMAIGVMPTDKTAIRKIVEYSYQAQTDNSRYTLSNNASYYVDMVGDLFENIAQVLLYVGLVLAAFAGLMMANFISTSIVYKKREIGILRAIGSRSNDVFRIFFAEAFVIAMINFVLSLIGCVAICIILNTTLRTEYGLLITFLSFGIRQFALLLGVSVGVAAVSSFLPVKKIASKRPIDAIRDR